MADVEVDILKRIERRLGVPGIADLLAERLPPADLQSLLMAVSRRRAARTGIGLERLSGALTP